jgi:regulator of sigma E protease
MDKLIALLCLQLLIVFHELGHYLLARLFDMRIERFSVGFGPRLLSLRRGETEFQLAAVPFGGFVQITGMAAGEDIDRSDPRLFPNKPMWQRFVVVLMGPIANFVLAALFFGFAFFHGVDAPDLSRAAVGQVVPAALRTRRAYTRAMKSSRSTVSRCTASKK